MVGPPRNDVVPPLKSLDWKSWARCSPSLERRRERPSGVLYVVPEPGTWLLLGLGLLGLPILARRRKA